ncbi:hypothetical protein IV417_05505 [Alphaproteobacteria bacterium KMM 3653]|uniref:Uncharacterized protein n=1 Tax=Harenicola maris TaxID=2841044 RepID=A0AAP2G7G9_9RHOB|nr:hypothetical protein [Harenicola maris]
MEFLERFSKEQWSTFNQIWAERACIADLDRIASDLEDVDRVLKGQVEAYRKAEDFEVYRRIRNLTNIENYRRMLLAIYLQQGIDATTDPSFSFVMDQNTMSGNAKARHVSLIAAYISNQQRNGAV